MQPHENNGRSTSAPTGFPEPITSKLNLPTVLATNWREVGRGSLVKIFDLHILPFFVVAECGLHHKKGETWVTFPSRSYEFNGERRWVPFFQIPDAAVRSEFHTIVLAAVARMMNHVVPTETATDRQPIDTGEGRKTGHYVPGLLEQRMMRDWNIAGAGYGDSREVK